MILLNQSVAGTTGSSNFFVGDISMDVSVSPPQGP